MTFVPLRCCITNLPALQISNATSDGHVHPKHMPATWIKLNRVALHQITPFDFTSSWNNCTFRPETLFGKVWTWFVSRLVFCLLVHSLPVVSFFHSNIRFSRRNWHHSSPVVFFSRNIGSVTPEKYIFFHLFKIYFLDQSLQNITYMHEFIIVKTGVLVGRSELFCCGYKIRSAFPLFIVIVQTNKHRIETYLKQLMWS